MLFWVLPALCLFLIGVKLLAQSMPTMIQMTYSEKVSARGLVVAFIMGTILTALTQSSSAVGVIVLILLDRNIVSFKQVGFFLAGSNLGTTISGQIFTLPLQNLIIPLFCISVFSYFMGYWFYNYYLKRISKYIFAFSLIFTGLQIMSSVAIYHREQLVLIFEKFNANYQAFLIGIVLTALSQSSSLIIGVLILLTGKQIITPIYATAAVMGLNIGTSSTLLIASLSVAGKGKLGAIFQIVYNSLCALLLFSLFPWYLWLIENISLTKEQFVANSHTVFNAAGIMLLILGWKYIEMIVKWITGYD